MTTSIAIKSIIEMSYDSLESLLLEKSDKYIAPFPDEDFI